MSSDNRTRSTLICSPVLTPKRRSNGLVYAAQASLHHEVYGKDPSCLFSESGTANA